MSISSSLLTPDQLSSPPDLDACRPLCRCGAVPTFPYVGMHGDGQTRRILPWPLFDSAGHLVFRWCVVIGRRYRCPKCKATRTINHQGCRVNATYGAAIVAALLYMIAPAPPGENKTHTVVHQAVREVTLPISERARTGQPRWSSLIRWRRDLAAIWPTLSIPKTDTSSTLIAFIASFGPGAPLAEVLDKAVRAHAQGGLAM